MATAAGHGITMGTATDVTAVAASLARQLLGALGVDEIGGSRCSIWIAFRHRLDPTVPRRSLKQPRSVNQSRRHSMDESGDTSLKRNHRRDRLPRLFSYSLAATPGPSNDLNCTTVTQCWTRFGSSDWPPGF